ncbi:MAG: phosphoribosylformylglycinamidine cyclo-ligase [Candidatus Lokiarchaeota archaeon]|nr:phosphoribosylformylglycinamidine cyclo-ligase [Candidatus Lokiarchaeota archaeon]
MSEDNKNLYSRLGVSSKKEDVHKAINQIDKGLFPGAFCKIVPDVIGRKNYCSIFHSDGAGTKSSLAYMYYKETDDLSVFRDIVQDAIVMNIDDVVCVGAVGDYFLSNNVGRNSHFISGDIISTIINEYSSYSRFLTGLGLKLILCGGETADVGDIVKSLLIDASVFTTMKKEDVIDASNIKPNDVIVGFASSGEAIYEDRFNSGIGSNGLTLARHGVLSHEYYTKYPECYNQDLDPNIVFFGRHTLTEKIKDYNLTVGKALLSPTRTYTPILIEVFKKYRKEIHGVIHNTGGGQTKILNYGRGIRYIKNNLFKLPKIFEIIQNSSETQWKEMFQVFNMGHRMELYCDEAIAGEIMNISRKFNVESKIIGHCEKANEENKNELVINSEFGAFKYV